MTQREKQTVTAADVGTIDPDALKPARPLTPKTRVQELEEVVAAARDAAQNAANRAELARKLGDLIVTAVSLGEERQKAAQAQGISD